MDPDLPRTVQRARELIAQEYAEQRSQEWLNLRENMITASDVASALGENHYESEDAFVKKKVLRTKWAGNAATAHGTLLEPIVRDLYDQKFNRKSHEVGLVQHPRYPWLGASPDGITEDGILVEIKCPLTRKIEPNVPKHYWPQVQLQLEITDLEECDFVQYRPGKDGKADEFVVVRVHRDREWFARALPILETVWQRVLRGRIQGLCEIVDEPAYIEKEIVCEIVGENETEGFIRETGGFIRETGSSILEAEPRPSDSRIVHPSFRQKTDVFTQEQVSEV